VRQKVKDILSVQIHKLDTELTELKELSGKISVPEILINSVPICKPKCYEVKLNNYGKNLYHLNSTCYIVPLL
jgi:hypothetical protein